MKSENQFHIYPNPNHSGVFYYSLGKSIISGKSRLEVIDCNGTIIYNRVITETEGQFVLGSNLPAGVYFFRFIFKGSVITKSIIMG